MALKTDYKDDIPVSERRKYQMVDNGDGTVSFVDVTEYSQEGDTFGAADINATNEAVNGKLDGSSTVDPMLATEEGFAADAKLTRDAISELNSNLPFKLAIDSEGNYGYIKDGADTVTPFKKGNIQAIKYLSYYPANKEATVTKGKTYIITTYNNPTITGLSILYNDTTESYSSTTSRLIVGIATSDILKSTVAMYVHEIEFA